VTTFTTEDLESLKTEWFPADINPVHLGLYEVNINSWPWPHLVEWTESGWDTTVEVKWWRGLKDKPE
jgi:hypothetical protein